jgi:hypothetical protein
MCCVAREHARRCRSRRPAVAHDQIDAVALVEFSHILAARGRHRQRRDGSNQRGYECVHGVSPRRSKAAATRAAGADDLCRKIYSDWRRECKPL